MQRWMRRGEHGMAFALTAIMLFVVLAISSLALDVGLALMNQRDLQSAADSEAFAGARLISNGTTTVSGVTGLRAQLANLAGQYNGHTFDATCGTWVGGNFVPNPPNGDSCARNTGAVNALQVETRRPLTTQFAKLFYPDSLVPRTVAVAATTRTVNCVAPFGVGESLFDTWLDQNSIPPVGTVFTTDTTRGNWGKLDLPILGTGGNLTGGGTTQNTNAYRNFLMNGACSPNANLSGLAPVDNGNSIKMDDVTRGLEGLEFYLPVVRLADDSGDFRGSANVQVKAVIKATLLSQNNRSGQNWASTWRVESWNPTLVPTTQMFSRYLVK